MQSPTSNYSHASSIKMHEEGKTKNDEGDVAKEGAVPAYLLDRQNVSRAKVKIILFVVLVQAVYSCPSSPSATPANVLRF